MTKAKVKVYKMSPILGDRIDKAKFETLSEWPEERLFHYDATLISFTDDGQSATVKKPDGFLTTVDVSLIQMQTVIEAMEREDAAYIKLMT